LTRNFNQVRPQQRAGNGFGFRPGQGKGGERISMSVAPNSHCQHVGRFDAGNPLAERNTWRVVGVSAGMMVIEIVAGWWFGSLALLADGWHMGTHVAALGITALAYRLARRMAVDHRFAFGTFKIEVLGGFASALSLSFVALLMAVESVQRLIEPQAVAYNQALGVAVLGLAVNLLSAWLLHDDGHDHGHDHDRNHDHDHDRDRDRDRDHNHDHDRDETSRQVHDLNLRAAYLHVLADAATSVLAIVALLGGKFQGWSWLDALTGLVGAVLIGVWSSGLIRATSTVLLDREMDNALVDEIRETMQADGSSRVHDLHVWRVGRNRFACILVVESPTVRTADEYHERLKAHPELAHVTIEVRRRPVER
jgi:cation diffusion facilitator family transporter